ncbi:hypothetical protein ASG36_06020 [Geodermatophilus sp. Leaf369]|uniref:DUF6779 domain-containing protein n=1 Tax=Geodermatophilus sp. Leaf369 TaxID=1736354 RepID=UPI0006FB3BCD|nr:DUF6779 domain-containing protein [Geodermatophilus sp. Leaf369]KQS60474.1 hypothetical protein ASG36_06020 [Geodermatophilus sp. Leaf369]
MAGEPDETGPRVPGTSRPGLNPVVRVVGLVLGFALAIAATLAVFLTEDALYLRLAVIAVAWAFVIAAFAAGRRSTDQAVAAGREAELRQAYELELEREVAARREFELTLENQLRREAQEAMRAELDQMRADLASVAQLRDQLAGLGELRADMGRLRRELTEQLSGEMLVERIVMRTQSIRMPADRPLLDGSDARLLEGTPAFPEPVVEQPRRAVPPPVPAPPRPAESTQALPRVVEPEPEPEPAPAPGPSTGSHAALWDAPAAVARTSDDGPAPRRHRRAAPEEEVVAVPQEPEHEPDVYETAGHQRLTQILAESGASAGAGGRRRRRAAEDDDGGDDVLARVLGRPS